MMSSTEREIFEKPYHPKAIEEKWYELWMHKGYFVADNTSKKKPFVIMMPPPNITGALHIGHALTATLQDILTRWKRMSGFNALWLPGTDHAGIATQNVVERELAKEGLNRHALGRKKFVEKVWQWREQYGRTISLQHQRLGVSCDWSRERFTMDEPLSKAVKEVFVRLYEEGLIYRGNYLINECPRCESALSDLEVTHIETEGSIWFLNYPLAEEKEFLTVATTRPETMLGDTAVAVHPKDDRYKSLIGKQIRLPLVDRLIPIIGDEYVDPKFGSGVVKITPGHDFNDFEVGQRHKLPIISIFNRKGMLNEAAGVYAGSDRFHARKKILEDLQTRGFLNREEKHKTSIGHCSRCDTIVEPRLSLQWFVRTKPLCRPAIKAVRAQEVKIIPEGWTKTYFHWMDNITDWCISRQIWWGHRIPAWYCKEHAHITVSRTEPTECTQCDSKQVIQDEDVLDTWFSSALWPFSTLGWPEQTTNLKVFYPSTVMETGFDILFFWVARMLMMGIHFMKKPPFQFIYLHAMVRDAKGQKMSKSRGNVEDPLHLIEAFGADALRFTLASLATPGRDVKLGKERIQGYRNFINKLWNATRFTLMNLDPKFHFRPLKNSKGLAKVHRWILTRLFEVSQSVHQKCDEYRLDEAAQVLYQFAWHEFCDWYIELIKPLLKDPQEKAQTEQILIFVLDHLMKLLHPFIPFVTEEIWQALPTTLPTEKKESIMIMPYPVGNKKWQDKKATAEMQKLMSIVEHIRNIRGEHTIPASKKIPVTFVAKEREMVKLLEAEKASIQALAGISELTILRKMLSTKAFVEITLGFVDILIPMTELFDPEEEKRRVHKEISKIKTELEGLTERLSQPLFLERAPKEVVEKEKDRLKSLEIRYGKLKVHLDKLNT